MTDIVDKATRSRMMSGIRGRDTKPEMKVRRYLHLSGFRFRLSPKYVFGKPDIVLQRYKTAVFVHGCYWHRHAECKLATTPTSNTEFWNSKFAANMKRDNVVQKRLESEGWNVLVIWECEISPSRLQMLEAAIRTPSNRLP